jgi:spermidine synthase
LMLASTLYVLVLPVELLIVFAGSVLIISYRWHKLKPERFELLINKEAKPILLLFIVGLVVVMGFTHVINKNYYALEMSRNFFGYKAVLEYPHQDGYIRALQHGITNHGFQRVEEGELVIEPSSYYGMSSGVGMAFTHQKLRKDVLNVVVLGLGSGGLAAHCREVDNYEFIEIDPQIIDLAEKHFTYLDFCPQAVVTKADGRLALVNRTNDVLYDLIILDAYADDMMPIHIMTEEALGIYKQILKPDGIIAMNISSRYLDLLPVAAVLAESNKLAIRTWFDRNPENPALVSSHWVLFAHDEELFGAEEFALMSTASDIDRRVTWTDTYSALWPIVKLW